MTSKLTEVKRQQFYNEIESLRSSLVSILEFSKGNLVAFNGTETQNYSYHFLQIFIRFRLNCEGLLNLMNAFKEDYRLKVCVNLLLRSICSDVLTAIYLFTFYDKDDPENVSLKNELDIISTEYLRSVKKIIEEDHELLTLLAFNPTTNIEEKREWYKSFSESLINEDGKLKSKNQIRLTTKAEIKEGLKTSGPFISEDEKYQRIKDKGFAQFGFAFTIFKYYSQFQHFTLSSRDLIEHEPFHDTFFMSLTIDQMLMTIDLILQISNTPNPDFREQIKAIRDTLSEKMV